MITKFKLFESRMSDDDIHRICKEYFIRNYIINPDRSISVDGDVDFTQNKIDKLPIIFKEVTGNFYCDNNQIITLEGCPEIVGGNFYCQNNQLESLEGCPETVGDSFYCYANRLKNLKGCPETVGDGFYCYNNQLTSLEWCPKVIGRDFDCVNNQLTSLEGCPEKVGNFYCYNNQLTSLEGCPEIVGYLNCQNNQIISFDGLPEFWEKGIDIGGNPVDEIYRLFNRDPKCIEWIREYDVIQGDKVSKHRLEEVFHTLNLEVPKNIYLREYILI